MFNVVNVFLHRSGGHCSHVVGVIYAIQNFKMMGLLQPPTAESCTSLPQQWNIPRNNKIAAAPVTSMIMANPVPPENRKRKPVLSSVFDNRYINISVREGGNNKQPKQALLKVLFTVNKSFVYSEKADYW